MDVTLSARASASTTSALTFTFATFGAPTSTLSPSISSNASKSCFLAASLICSTVIVSPSETTYCLPPVRITAFFICPTSIPKISAPVKSGVLAGFHQADLQLAAVQGDGLHEGLGRGRAQLVRQGFVLDKIRQFLLLQESVQINIGPFECEVDAVVDL